MLIRHRRALRRPRKVDWLNPDLIVFVAALAMLAVFFAVGGEL